MKVFSLNHRPYNGLVLVIGILLCSALLASSLPLVRASINDALDCDYLTFSTFFSGSGGPWFEQTTIKCTGASAMQSGSLYTSDPYNPSYCYIQTGVYGPGHLYFWWKVSCGPGSWLYLVDTEQGPLGSSGSLGVLADIIGETDWTWVDVVIPPGYYVLQWRYEESTIDGGSNAGWLDCVGFVPTWPMLAVRGLDNAVYYRGYDRYSEAWGSWDVTPGATGTSPAAATFRNHLQLVVRGMDGSSLWWGTVDYEDPRTGFEGWWPLEGATSSAPTLTRNGIGTSTSDEMCLVVRGLDNRIYYCLYAYDERDEDWCWFSWNVIPTGATCDSPAAALIGDELNIVVRGMDGSSLWYTKIRITDNAVLEGWTQLSGATPSKPVLAAAQDVYNPTTWPTTLYLVVRGMDNGIWYRECEPDDSPPTWNSWTKMSGATCDAPAACYWWEGWAAGFPGNYLHVVVRGLDGNTLWHTRLFQDSSWSLITGATPSAPTLAG